MSLSTSAPTIDELAPAWLRHMVGFYDYPAECERLLIALARKSGIELSAGPRGVPMSNYIQPRSEAEAAIAEATLQFRRAGYHESDVLALDRYRWSLFEPALDDRSVTTWAKNATRETS